METVKFSDVSEKVIIIREQNVILDSSVAELYGVETRLHSEIKQRRMDKLEIKNFDIKPGRNYRSFRTSAQIVELSIKADLKTAFISHIHIR